MQPCEHEEEREGMYEFIFLSNWFSFRFGCGVEPVEWLLHRRVICDSAILAKSAVFQSLLSSRKLFRVGQQCSIHGALLFPQHKITWQCTAK